MENVLKHHGVKGMKWGVRKDIANSAAEATRQSSSAASRISNATKKNKKVAEMSDEELRKAINRMDLEKRYSDLNPSAKSRGAAKVADILAVTGSVVTIGASVASILQSYHNYKKGTTTP